ncbi:MAG TPA: class I SAM-dependent methyltransferase [Thermoleophilia bacterium]|nr:class I SAM-dependent methyltransferase [Thermoleophilia bacterium]
MAVPDVCPAEHAGWLSTPLRRLVTDPRRILRGLLCPGDTVVDLGCGPGFFTLPLAETVGETGRVAAVDLQSAMLDRVRARAERQGLLGRIDLHECPADSLDLTTEADFVLAFWMVHEVPDSRRFLAEVRGLLKRKARFLIVEPKGHVDAAAFARTTARAVGTGMTLLAPPRVAFSRTALLGAAPR